MKIDVYADGCALNNGKGGNGGIGVYLTSEELNVQISRGFKNVTNNQMEIKSAIVGIEEALRIDSDAIVVMHCDSNYVVKGITEWIERWKLNGWCTAKREPVKNKELWMELDRLNQENDVIWNWVKGHDNIEGNEMADMLAKKGAREI